MRVLSFVMAETLAAHGDSVDLLGELLHTDMRNWWSPDETFYALLRDKDAINAMLREIAGARKANAHLPSKMKVQKQVIADCLAARSESEPWLPGYLAFPARGYTERFAQDRAEAPPPDEEDYE